MFMDELEAADRRIHIYRRNWPRDSAKEPTLVTRHLQLRDFWSICPATADPTHRETERRIDTQRMAQLDEAISKQNENVTNSNPLSNM